MATDGLSGSYTYLELRAALKQQGIKSSNLNPALKQVESDNDIDNIKKLDGEEKVTVAQSVFDQYAQETSSTVSDVDLFSFNTANLFNSEIYNDEDYEIADYDDFYNFGNTSMQTDPNSYAQLYAQQNGISLQEAKQTLQSKYGEPELNSTNNQDQTQKEINFEQFTNQYAAEFTNSNSQNPEQNLNQIFNSLDTNSNGYLNQEELSSAYNAGSLIHQKEDYGVNAPIMGREDLMGDDMMEMDMSNDSFNPQ